MPAAAPLSKKSSLFLITTLLLVALLEIVILQPGDGDGAGWRLQKKSNNPLDKFVGERKTKKVKQQIEALKRQEEAKKKKAKTKKEIEDEKKREKQKLYYQEKVPAGVDPKSIMCVYFKNNCCTKGSKCKYSHDPKAPMKYDAASHKKRFNHEKEIGILEKEKQLAVEREDFELAAQLKKDIEKMQADSWRQKNPEATQEEIEAKLKELRMDDEKPITEKQFMAWYSKRRGEHVSAERERNRVRVKRGLLTGKEFFMQKAGQEIDEFKDSSDAEGIQIEEVPADDVPLVSEKEGALERGHEKVSVDA